MGGEVNPHGARNSALKNVAPVRRTVRNTSDSTSTCGVISPGDGGKVFWTLRKDGPSGTSLQCAHGHLNRMTVIAQ